MTETDGPGPGAARDGEGEGMRLTELASFDAPVFITQPPKQDGAPYEGSEALYVVEQGGRIRVLEDGSVRDEPFLDISEEVSGGTEQGLLGLAFAPDYGKSGLFYVNFTDTEGDTNVVEYRRSDSDPFTADPASARLVLFQDQPFENHNGGELLFGPDDLLYIGLGDGGSAGDPDRNGQNLGTFLGKLLRIDPAPAGGEPYSVPPDNPFVDTPGALPEIYSYGLRNPWRFSFDRETGDLSIGDVGQDHFEEIDFVAEGDGAGANFGWSAFEGNEPFNSDQRAEGHVPPVLTYSRDEGRCSVTGGYVVRDPDLPALEGRYLYGDFCEGRLHSFTPRPGQPATDDELVNLTVPQLSSFGEDTEANIYALSLEGPVYRLEPAD